MSEQGPTQRVEGRMPPPLGCEVLPAVLHIGHSWGGGVARWIEDFAHADLSARHLLLRLVPQRDALGTSVELVDMLEGGGVLLRWELPEAIGVTALRHQPYAGILRAVTDAFGVVTVMVSSLVGHALDVFDTGLPTVVVLHDFYPFCPAMFAWFGAECTSCDAAALERCRAHNPYNVLWSRADPQGWLKLREVYGRCLERGSVHIVAPSASIHARYARLFPVLRDKPWRLIAHGIDLTTLGSGLSPRQRESGARLRIVVPGRLSPHKGLHLLSEIIDGLSAFADVLLLGAGEFGRAFAATPGVTVVADYAPHELGARIREFAPDCALLLSVLPESFSYTLSEMWALGVPVVATRLGAFAERIEDGVTGLLVEPDAQAVLACLRNIAQDPARLDDMARRVSAQRPRSRTDMVADYRALLPLPCPTPRAEVVGPDAVVAGVLAALRETRAHAHRVEAALSSLGALHAECRRAYEEAMAARDAVEAELAAQRAHAGALEQVLSGVQQHLEQVLNSRSWRLTRPLRSLRGFTRGHGVAAATPQGTAVSGSMSAQQDAPVTDAAQDAPDREAAQERPRLCLYHVAGDPVSTRRVRQLSARLGQEAVELGARTTIAGGGLGVSGGAQELVVVPSQALAGRVRDQGGTAVVLDLPLVGEWTTAATANVWRVRQRELLCVSDAARLVIGCGAMGSGLLSFACIAARVVAQRNGHVFVWLGQRDDAWLEAHWLRIGPLVATRMLFLVDDEHFEPWFAAADAYLGCGEAGVYDAGAVEALAAGVGVVVSAREALPDAIRMTPDLLDAVSEADPVAALIEGACSVAGLGVAHGVRERLGSLAAHVALDSVLRSVARGHEDVGSGSE